MWRRSLAAVLVSLFAASAARAAVVDAQPNGFEVRQAAEIAAPADKVWAALARVGAWWDPAHTWSQESKNLSLDLAPGGCFCETFPGGGGARHMVVINVLPGRRAILEGALGPLSQTGASGHLVWALVEKDGRTTLTQTYFVGGYTPGGFAAFAPAVDGVLESQIERLKRYVETGAP
jgi:uncharacterized protein YndB with AHSA1/START domain